MPKRRTYYIAFALFSLIYLVGTLIAPLTPNRFNLSITETRFLRATIAVPIIFIWFAAVYGAERFKNYTHKIKEHKDGKALDRIATGITILVISVMANGINGILRPWAIRDGWLPAYTILHNYIAAILPLIAYAFMYFGSVELLKLTKNKKKNNYKPLAVVALLSVIATIYTMIIFNYDYRNTTPDPSKFSSFFLPDGLIAMTLVAPFLIGWGAGMHAAFNLWSYQQNVKGLIYKKALLRLVAGSLLVIAFGVITQMLIGLSTYFAQAGLASILIIVYLLILLYSLGFLVIASGGRKLNKIEEVK